MDKQAEDALTDLSEMVNTEGWKVLTDDVEKKIEAIKEELTTPSLDMNGDLLRIAQGRILAYRDILAIPIVVQHALTQGKIDDEGIDIRA